MAIKISQSLKQSQNLMMTPQLQQAIKLLTMTHLEMSNVIADEMVENPMLEEIDPGQNEVKDDSDYTEERLEMQTAEATTDNFDDKPIIENNDDFDWQSYAESFNSTSSTPSMATPNPDELPNYENIVSKGESLAEHLEWQLRMENFSEEEWNFCLQMIHNINDDGYLDLPFSELIKQTTLKKEYAEDIRDTILSLDPVGCGAESLSECLLAQARIAEERSPLLEAIIKNHLDDIKNRDLNKIVEKLGVASESVDHCIEILKNFHPKPGRLVASQDTHYVIPDIYVVEVGGEFVVKVNDDGIPRLRISNQYMSMLKQDNKDAKEYVQDKLRSAMWLIKSIQNRQRTIVKVAKAIVRQQQDFFKRGPRFLKPMVLKDIANEIGMHESTVSRVTTNKYMHTPIGLFELKYFFNAGIGGKNGGIDVSSEALKLKIKELVGSENPKKPLSDQKIAELLSRDDVKVARRTIAKYREMLGILSSSKRKIK